MADEDGKGKDGERPKAPTPEQLSSQWQVEIGLAERDHKSFRDSGKLVVDRYRSEQRSVQARRGAPKKFNILYSNTEVLRAALYGRAAKPDVRRRFADADPVAREAADVVERGLIYCAETYDVDKPIELGVLDYLLPGRGVLRIEYEPVMKDRPVVDPMTAMPVMGPEGKPVTEEFIAEQKLRERYVYWEDYLQGPARNWEGVTWVAYRHTMDKDSLKDLIGGAPEGTSKVFVAVEDIPLNWSPELGDRQPAAESLNKAEVWEVWDKTRKERVWIVKGCRKALRRDTDPYGLDGFFPQAEPITSYTTNDTAIPEPEFFAYRDQADDLDEITSRISVLTKALKRRGVRDKSIGELQRLARAGDNDYIAVQDWSSLVSKGGLAGVFDTEDIQPIAIVLAQLYTQRDQLVQAIFELTGIADIMRGNSDPGETLGAQQLKAQFGSVRMKRRQRAVQKWIRDSYKLKAEIIAEHFEPTVLSEMTGKDVTPEIIQLLRSDKLRSYRIDVETDSTIFEDSAKAQAEVTALIESVTKFIGAWGPMVQQQPELLPLAFEMLAVAVRQFKAGRELEDVVEQTKQTLVAKAQQAEQQPPAPNPDEEKAKAEMEMARESHQMDMQASQVDMQGKVVDLKVHQAKAQTDMQKLAMQTEADMQEQAMQQSVIPGGVL